MSEGTSQKNQLPELEEICPTCRGTGKLRGQNGYIPCSACDGAKFMPTKFGERVLDLMRHNFRPMLEEVQD